MNQDHQRASVLITPQDLAGELASPPAGGLVVLDVRWDLPLDGTPFPGHEYYLTAHLPGAVYVDLDTELAAPPSTSAGRHPLPALADFQAAARRWGINQNSLVVAYDETGGLAAARVWWLLRYYGFARVRVLDGGLPAWLAAGYPIQTGDCAAPASGNVTLSGAHLPTLDADAAAHLARAGRLLDGRSGARYRGEFEPVDPRAGHIPGARSAPTGHNLVAAAGAFRTGAEIAQRHQRHGVSVVGSDQVGVYCGSGVTAAHTVLALASIGVEAALYPGSWSQWSNDLSRPVETGPDPHQN